MYPSSVSIPTKTVMYVKYAAIMTYWNRSTVPLLHQFKPPNTSFAQALTLIFCTSPIHFLVYMILDHKIYAQLIVVNHFLFIHVHCTVHTHAYKGIQVYKSRWKERVHAYTIWLTVCIAFQWGSVRYLQQSGFRKYFDLRCPLSTWQHFQDEQMVQRWDGT